MFASPYLIRALNVSMLDRKVQVCSQHTFFPCCSTHAAVVLLRNLCCSMVMDEWQDEDEQDAAMMDELEGHDDFLDNAEDSDNEDSRIYGCGPKERAQTGAETEEGAGGARLPSKAVSFVG